MAIAIESIDTVSPIQEIQPIDSVDSVDSVQIKAREAENIPVSSPQDTSNLFALAVELSFSQIGLFDSSPTPPDDRFSSVPAQQIDLIPFTDSLLNALQAQSIQTTLSPTDMALNMANSGTFGLAVYKEHHYYHSGENSGLLVDLQNLIQEVSSVDPIASISRNDNDALFLLMQNYQMLLSYTEASDKTSSDIGELGRFLEVLLKNVQGVDSSGNFIDTID